MIDDNQHREAVYYAPSPEGRRHYKMTTGVCPSVCLYVACFDFDSLTERSTKPKIGRMEAHHTSNSWTYLEVKRSKVKVTRPINAVRDIAAL